MKMTLLVLKWEFLPILSWISTLVHVEIMKTSTLLTNTPFNISTDFTITMYGYVIDKKSFNVIKKGDKREIIVCLGLLQR